ncbi:MAG: hypothetical protein PUF72_05230 [Clostridiales bacterium]|nr:hypothetical protein [Clostridiales bacterium]
MAPDTIVFEQEGLDRAIAAGFVSIGLCDNTFVLPPKTGITYMAIGSVSVSIPLTRAQCAGIHFNGFEPKFAPDIAYVPRYTPSACVPTSGSGSWGSFGSYASSYGSFFHMYEYEYEYGSFNRGSFGFGSFGYGSFSGSFGSYNHIINPFVKGYGINLI